MPLNCSCGEAYDCDWYYQPSEDFSVLDTKRSRRCRSCNTLIKPGSDCLSFIRTREPLNDIEEEIYGSGWDSVPLATWYQCLKCGEMYLNLHALGYCIEPDENIFALLKEYHELTGFKSVERHLAKSPPHSSPPPADTGRA